MIINNMQYFSGRLAIVTTGHFPGNELQFTLKTEGEDIAGGVSLNQINDPTVVRVISDDISRRDTSDV